MSARRTRKDDGSQWTVADSRSVYGIRHWGAGYFSINDAGRIEVRPNGPDSQPIDLYQQVDELRQSGLSLPLLVRFPDILQDRLGRIAAREVPRQHHIDVIIRADEAAGSGFGGNGDGNAAHAGGKNR